MGSEGGTKRKPFTLRERRRMSQTFGNRPRNNWGSGDLPGPWCEGDVVEMMGEPHERLHGMVGPFFVVTYACSIDEGDAWYFRVSDGIGWNGYGYGSDRLHVAYADRSSWDDHNAVDFMAPFRLVETVDPEGLAERERLIAEGWTFVSDRCPTCDGTGRIHPLFPSPHPKGTQ